MGPFAYSRVQDAGDAVLRASRQDGGAAAGMSTSQFIAGGTTLADLMKLDVMRPQALLDINPAAKGLGRIDVTEQGLRLGALVRMAEAEDHPAIVRHYPVIADTLRLAASPQIRNMASLGGNLLQRTRCEYFREPSFPCNKRQPGSGCSALGGINRQHAVLGTSDRCIATYPGDFALALMVLGASVETQGPDGRRTIPIDALHRVPGDTPEIETILQPGELMLAITVPASGWAARSRYVKVRDRTSYAFALASAAVALELDGDVVKQSRIAVGGVTTKPWRAQQAEAALQGKALNEEAAEAAADAAFADARAREHNRFKVPLGKATLVRALLETQEMKV